MKSINLAVLGFLTALRATLSPDPSLALPGLVILCMCFLLMARDLMKNGLLLVRRFHRRLLLPIFFYLLLVASCLVSLIYGGLPLSAVVQPIILITFCIIFGTLYFSFPLENERRATALRSLFWSVSLFTSINFVLFLLGFEAPKELHSYGYGTATLPRIFGFEVSRVMFPLASGINSYGTLLVVSAIFSAFSLQRSTVSYLKIYHIVSILIIFICLLLLDSRMALICCLLGLIMVFGRWSVPLIAFFYRGVILVVPFSSMILLSFAIVFGSVLSNSVVTRSSTDIATVSNRSFIWGPVIEQVISPSAKNIFGYGYRGQIGSGIADANRYYFEHRLDNYRNKTVHNLGLQYYLDIGLVGIVFFVFLLSRVRFNLKTHEGRLSLISLAFMILPGVSEASPMVYQAELFLIFSGILFFGYQRPEDSATCIAE